LKDDRPDDMTVDDWNEIYLEVTRELHEVLAKQLIQESKQDEQTSFEEYERFS